MSAKHSKKSGNNPAPPRPAAAPSASEPTPVTVTASGAAVATVEPTSWLDSSDPRKRLWGKIIFAGIWIYVAALWLLALDQTFNWGIFGPKVPPVP